MSHSYPIWSWERVGVCTATAGAPACLHIPGMSTAAPATSTRRGCAWHIGAHTFIISRGGCFLSWPGSNLCWKGAPSCNLVKNSCFKHVLLLLQQSPSFSWDFKTPWLCGDYLCSQTAGSLKKHPAPRHRVRSSSQAATVMLPGACSARGIRSGAIVLCPGALPPLLWSCGSPQPRGRSPMPRQRQAAGTRDAAPSASARGVRSHPAFPGWLQPRQQSRLSL